MLKFFLAARYLKSKKIVLLSIVAVALSTALLVTVASLFTAFIDAIESGASAYMGDIIVSPPTRFYKSDEFLKQLNASESISAVTKVLSTNGLIHLGSGDVKAVNIWGIDIDSRSKVTDIKNNLLVQKALNTPPVFGVDEKTSNSIPAFVGMGLVGRPDTETDEYDIEKVKLRIGKPAVITAGSVIDGAKFKTASAFQTTSAKIKICDILFTSVYEIDQRYVFVPIDSLAEVLKIKEVQPADMVNIKCAKGFSAKQAVNVVREIWEKFASEQLGWSRFLIADTEIMTSVAKQNQYTNELRKQMGVLLIVFGVISAGVIVLVFCIFYMIVMAKQKDLAVIKSIGGSSFSAAAVFLIFGLFIGLIGSAAGIAVGYFVTTNANVLERWVQVVFGFKAWSSSIYMFEKIPDNFNWLWGRRFFGCAVIASVIGAIVPAISAAKTVPAKILRYE